eukprot:scaffold1902_cov159-Pinguiococcus_pyrenoidosus.AAC.3
MKRSVYGLDASNTDIANTLQNLGIVKRQLGDLQGAQELYTQALDMQRRVYGADASNTSIELTLRCLQDVERELQRLESVPRDA